MPIARLVRVLLTSACLLLALPALAAATTYEVTSIGIGLDNVSNNDVCQTATVGECTLRAAIEESNTHAGEDVITFKESVFDGQLADTIPGTGLPAITQTVTIVGDRGGAGCTTQAGGKGPCAGVEGTGLTVNNADEVLIRGLAITGATTGINVIGSSEEFVAFDNWLGVKLNGAAGANGSGITLDPDSDDARIGTFSEPGEVNGNVFANNTTIGLDLLGVDGATIAGNYFGVKPDGVTPAANVQNLEVTGAVGFSSIGTQIGATIGEAVPAALTSTACDGGCNVFAATVSTSFVAAIDFQAESGQNEIPVGEGGLIEGAAVQGNFIGLDATGAAMATTPGVGVMAIGAENTIIGGGQTGDANQIHAGEYGVYGSDAPNLRVGGNRFGVNQAGTALLSPNSIGVFVFTESIPPGTNALIAENQIASGSSGIGIKIQGAGAIVVDNMIGLGKGGQLLGAGGIGVYAWGNLGGSLIERNAIVNASQVGVLLQSEGNSVADNEIEGSEEAGVRVEAAGLPVDGEIGSDEEEFENEISNTNGPAIELIGQLVDELVIRGNFGEGNAGQFIDIGGNGPGVGPNPPNQGILPPTFGSIANTGVSGTSLPEAIVRVFRKATSSPGELESLLGTAEADDDGKWSLIYGSAIPGDTNIAATQTAAQGTSELVLGVTPPDPPSGCNDALAAAMCVKPLTPPSADVTPPKVTIKKAPKPKSTNTTAKFKFVSNEAGSSFQCKLDRKPFAKCKSPKTYKQLKPGKHVFKVKATDAAGNPSAVVKRKFTVLE